MIIYEYCTSSGKIKSFSTYGHVGSDPFRKACVDQFGKSPNIVNHVYKVDKQIIKRNKKNKIISRTEVSKYYPKWELNSIRMTVGIV